MISDIVRSMLFIYDEVSKSLGGAGAPFTIPELDFSFVDKILPFKFSFDGEVSTSTDDYFSGPKIFIDFEVSASLLKFDFYFHLVLNLSPDLDILFSEPLNALSDSGLWITADAWLPWDIGDVKFMGIVTPYLFSLNATARVDLWILAFDAFLSFEWQTFEQKISLGIGGNLEVGPFGWVSLYGSFSNDPELSWALEASVNVGIMGFCMGGYLSAGSEQDAFTASLQAQMGWLGEMSFYTEIGRDPFYIVLEGGVEIDFEEFLGELVDWIVGLFSGEDEPADDNLVANGLKKMFNFLIPVQVTYLKFEYDSRQSTSPAYRLPLDDLTSR